MKKRIKAIMGVVLMIFFGLFFCSSVCCFAAGIFGGLKPMPFFDTVVMLTLFFLFACVCVFGFKAGYRLKKSIVSKQVQPILIPAVKALPNPKLQQNTDYSPVIRDSDAEIWMNTIKLQDDWAKKKKGRIPYDMVAAGTTGIFLRERGYTMTSLMIGGGSTEVSHTGAVAYGAKYTNLESYLENCETDYIEAEKEAAEDYRNWFSELNYHYILQEFEKNGSSLRLNFAVKLEISGDFTEESHKVILHDLTAFLTE